MRSSFASSPSVALIVPAVVTFVLTAFAAAPPMFMGGLTPMGFFLGVLTFGVASPRAMPILVVAVLSLFADTVSGAPLGAHGLVSVALLVVLSRRAKIIMRQSMMFLWVALAAALLTAQVLLLGVYGILGYAVSPLSAGASWLVTLPLVPVMVWVAMRITDRSDG